MPSVFAPEYFPWVALAFGLVLGSFANVCVHRLPRGLSVVWPPSGCPRCGAPIRASDNVPVLGWLRLAGFCRTCRQPISLRYPLVEAANGALYFVVAAQGGAAPRTFVEMALATALLVLSLIDAEFHLLPDAITLPGVAVGIAASFLAGGPGPVESLLAAVGGYLGMGAIAKVAEWHYGQEALGQGDWKLVAMLGAFLGVRSTLLAVFLATALGAGVGLLLIASGRASRRTALPLGTFLGLAGIGVLLGGQRLLDWLEAAVLLDV